MTGRLLSQQEMRWALLVLPFVLVGCGSTKHAAPPSFTV
jgi:hypothetical protein